MKEVAACMFVLFAFGCMPGEAKTMNKISTGMSKEDVRNILGKPKTSSANDGFEYWKYDLSTAKQIWVTGGSDDYMVKFKDGRVVGYGKEDEFAPTQNVNMKIKHK